MAKSQVDRIFERAPLDFLRAYTISPGDFTSISTGFLSARSIYDQKPHTQVGGAAIDSTLTIKGYSDKVAYTTLEEVVDFTGQREINAYKLFFRTAQEVGANADDYIACWFLPWASNHLTKMRIPPKLPPRPGVKFIDPDIFFTAAINGCSVMVAGDPKSPIITHGGTADSRSKLSEDNAFQNGNARQHWLNLFKQDLARSGNTSPILGIHKDDYINYALTGTTREAAQYEKFLEDNRLQTMRIDSVRPQGAVFGLRDGTGDWSFYLQKKVTITFTRLRKIKKLIGKSKYEPVEIQTGRVHTKTIDGKKVDVPVVALDSKVVSFTVELVKFFPGTGTGAATAMVDPARIKAVLESYM
ncbi:MAG TPA: hypothetical protein VG675_05785 [Bryobacteraceae bacterium]|nr:hypothetical protein [Bryobacteraceae bacterium]